MKKFVALLTFVLAIGFVNAQVVEPSESVKQKVDATISQYEGKLNVADTEKEEIRQIMYRYETLIENELKSVGNDAEAKKRLNTNIQKHRADMQAEIKTKLTPEQIEKVWPGAKK